MIHYHGTPCGGQREQAERFLSGRHALIPFVRTEDIAIAADVCQSFCIDNGAFTAWKQGIAIDWELYYDFCDLWHRHPAFDWAIIPDVIDGDEDANDQLIEDWPAHLGGIPVWHMHESLDRLNRLCGWYRIALGSSGDYAMVGNDKWWRRMAEAMEVCCDADGRPRTRLHGLRMLDPKIFKRLPLASADSTNAVRNANLIKRFGMYPAPNLSTRMSTIAERIESHQSASVWRAKKADNQPELFSEEAECLNQ
jgi:hypothetical protein